ncbi:hypothetical protein B0H15DRAFT_605916 [Mycena belliarum]|uniref:IBR domain-containing protein n=1 Tax=Mycena belliarum TaxID=1033014 RepID=A0AAD6XI24_9AGAR|nr:hypothetical protein B0H15DRAFT_605916 [Mycena belliae]
MFKKYKAFMNNEGKFAQPGARALQDFISLYDQQLQEDRVAQAVKAAEARARLAEEQAREAEERASRAERPSAEEVTRERLFPETIYPELVQPRVEPKATVKSAGKACTICFRICHLCPNPWQRARSDRNVLRVRDITQPKASMPYGTVVKPCNHVFCGACLAQAIYHSLNMAFDPATYGTVLPAYEAPGLGPAEFPVFCPKCPVKKGKLPVEISDLTARLVLGEPNMDEWKYARFLSRLNIIYCPHRGCNEPFDVEDVLPTQGEPNLVQCPRCQGSICTACKSIWHDNMTCLMYQALPLNVVHAQKPAWISTTSSPYRPEVHSPRSPPSPKSPISPARPPHTLRKSQHSAGNSPVSAGKSPMGQGRSSHSTGRSPISPLSTSSHIPPWAREENMLAH